eukprot:8249976-Karenia_brevis.AAC.1
MRHGGHSYTSARRNFSNVMIQGPVLHTCWDYISMLEISIYWCLQTDNQHQLLPTNEKYTLLLRAPYACSDGHDYDHNCETHDMMDAILAN